MSVKLPEFIKFRGATYKRASEYEGENLVHEAWGASDAHGGGYQGYVVSYDPSLGDPVAQGIQGNKSRREDEYLGEFPSRKYAVMAAKQWEDEQWHRFDAEEAEEEWYRSRADEEAWYAAQEEERAEQEHADMEQSYRPKVRELGRNRYVPSSKREP